MQSPLLPGLKMPNNQDLPHPSQLRSHRSFHIGHTFATHDLQSIPRKSSMGAGPAQDPSRLSRKPSHRSGGSSKLTRQDSQRSGSDRDTAKLTRKNSSFYCGGNQSRPPSTNPADYAGRPSGNDQDEKKERRRKQNTESARRTRDRRRKELEAMEKAHAYNAERIHYLERMADELSGELRRSNTFNVGDSSRAPIKSFSGGVPFEEGGERPGWFGTPF